jgi:hypothetical protein
MESCYGLLGGCGRDPCDRDGIDDRGWRWWCLRVLEESDRGAEMTDNLMGRCLVAEVCDCVWRLEIVLVMKGG